MIDANPSHARQDFIERVALFLFNLILLLVIGYNVFQEYALTDTNEQGRPLVSWQHGAWIQMGLFALICLSSMVGLLLYQRHRTASLVERQRNEATLRDNERRLEKITAIARQSLLLQETAMKAAANTIVITDMAGTIQWANPAFTRGSGYTLEEAIGQNPRILKSGRHNASFYEKLWQTILAGEVWRGVFINKRKDGRLVHEESTITPVTDETGKIIHFIAIKQDVTERVQAEQALQEAKRRAEVANRAKSDFLAAMSHEIRTPMNVVLGMSDSLLETDLDAEQHQLVQIMVRSGRALLAVINDVLDFSRIEAGRFTLSDSPFSPGQMVKETARLMRMAAEEKGLLLSDAVATDLPAAILGDDGRLRQVLINLLGNAIKFTQQGQISIQLLRHPEEPETLLFRVTDTGIGIASEHLDRIFDHFTQADSGIARRYGGTGLGLAISQRLVELMGGRMGVESQPGQGSTFFFTLPMRVVDPLPDQTAVVEPLVGGATRSLRILLAEDSPDNQLLFQIYLKKSTHHLVVVNDGLEAVARVRKERFDLLLTDIEMPNLDGHAATRAIRQWEQEEGRPPLTIMALSAHASLDKRAESLAAGCDGHLTKPIRKQELLDAIQRVADPVRKQDVWDAIQSVVREGVTGPTGGGDSR